MERHTDDALRALFAARNWSQQQHWERMRRLDGSRRPFVLGPTAGREWSVPPSQGLPLFIDIHGRNNVLELGKVGLRCRHWAHLPIYKRQKGAVYFPFKIQGIYQATQNMWTIHLQSGVCSELPEAVSQEFARILADQRRGQLVRPVRVGRIGRI